MKEDWKWIVLLCFLSAFFLWFSYPKKSRAFLHLQRTRELLNNTSSTDNINFNFGGGGREGTFEKQIGERRYTLHLPSGILDEMTTNNANAFNNLYNNKPKGVPLLVVFHGVNHTAASLAVSNDTNWVTLANKHRFIIAFPQSWGRGWRLLKSKYDLEFTYSVVSTIVLDYAIDPDRIYAVGIGNGGLFVTSVAVRYSHVFAACGSFMGGFKHGVNLSPLEALRKIPLLFTAGSNDPSVGQSIEACRIFTAFGHQVKLELIPDVGHQYQQEKEPEIWEFLTTYTLASFNPAHGRNHTFHSHKQT